MHIVSAIVGAVGAVAVAAGALIYFAKPDNSDAFALQMAAFIFLVPGALLLLLALILLVV